VRAERVRWKGRSRLLRQAPRNMGERLRRMNEQASLLDERIGHHAEESESWHRKWDDPGDDPLGLANTQRENVTSPTEHLARAA
jgi:hypothetical protein